jgi:hypothetical protein
MLQNTFWLIVCLSEISVRMIARPDEELHCFSAVCIERNVCGERALSVVPEYENMKLKKKTKLNSVAFSPQANYTDRTTAACRRS